MQCISDLQNHLGADTVLLDPKQQHTYLQDNRGIYQGKTCAVILPDSVSAVAETLQYCHTHQLAVVAQGGNTGYMGGAIPNISGDNIVLNLQRLNHIRSTDALNNSLSVDAGCTLEQVQYAAQQINRQFPLGLSIAHRCQIGGNLATNAGGTGVLRYGNARDLVLGLEVVLADGQIWDGMTQTRKNNTGYDLKHLFLGAEGTLGIITGAVLKLLPTAPYSLSALINVRSIAAAINLLHDLQTFSGQQLSAFEYFENSCLDFVAQYCPEIDLSHIPTAQHTILLKIESAIEYDWTQQLTTLLTQHDAVIDFMIADTPSSEAALWAIRAALPQAQNKAANGLKHDIALPLSQLATFCDKAAHYQQKQGIRSAIFGHFGDGNLHYNLFPAAQMSPAQWQHAATHINQDIHDLAVQLGGSFSAEHGIGQAKKNAMLRYKSQVELSLMRRLKQAIDPKNSMNPDKIL